MRIESGDDDRAALAARPVDGTTDHGLMTQMKPVKIPQRDNSPAKFRRHCLAATQPLHGAGYRGMGREGQLGVVEGLPQLERGCALFR